MAEAGDIYDVCVVGAGPAGSTCAYYLARHKQRVLVLEKERFPRDKLCGDAICGNALLHLERMGVLPAVLAAGEGRWTKFGGIVSPGGVQAMGDSAQTRGRPVAMAIKRVILDARIARAAADAGAVLMEGAPVSGAEFSHETRTWTVHCRTTPATSYRARVLVAADGALSRLARSLGLVTTPPDAICSRAYVAPGTHRVESDGVAYYSQTLLPGYFALLREASDEVNLCCYILPGGKPRLGDLKSLHEGILRDDVQVRAALGPEARIDRMRAAPLRLGGIPRSYGEHLLVLGDAAGQIDPLTGEGIQYAMDGAEIAAQTLAEAFHARDWSAQFLRRYEVGWRKLFGFDFRWSRTMAVAGARYPLFLDACAEVLRRRGPEFFAKWAEVMTGARPKRSFLHPRMLVPILTEAARQWWRAKSVPRPK